MIGRIDSICTAGKRGQKKAAHTARLIKGFGIEGDVHGGNWHRQVSLLEKEDIEELKNEGLTLEDGAFGENIIVENFRLTELKMGQRIRIGKAIVLQITQFGKECHTPCQIFHKAGRCIMPDRGVFARVVRGGFLNEGDEVCTDNDLDGYRCAVLTISDKGSKGERKDTAGPFLEKALSETVHVFHSEILPDDKERIQKRLAHLCDEEVCDVIFTAGGTGLSPRDVTPEATLEIIEREIPGMAEAIRAEGLKHTPRAMLSRGVCGQRGTTIVINLSGSEKAVKEQIEVILPVLSHALETAAGISGDCARTGH